MGWTSPRTWNVGEIVTKVLMDLHIRDNLKYLKGESGVVTTQSGLIIDNTDGDEYIKLPLLSTAECATVLNVAGEVAYDEATNRIKMYGAALNSVVTTADVDDTPVDAAATDPISSNWAYDFQQTLTAAGDIPYATAAGVWSKLGIGTALQLLRTNAAATAPEWGPSALAFITSGSYTGNDAADRAIAHGLGVTPKIVFIVLYNGSAQWNIVTGLASFINYWAAAGFGQHAVTTPTSTNFYVGNAGSYLYSANYNTYLHYWVAIG